MLMAILSALAAAAQAGQPAAHSQAPDTALWVWQEPTPRVTPILVRIVRGEVTIVHSNGPVRVEVRRTASTGRAEDAEMVAEERASAIVIEDRYPTRSRFSPMNECLPAVGARGDFWTHDVRLDVTVFAPATRRIESEIGASRD